MAKARKKTSGVEIAEPQKGFLKKAVAETTAKLQETVSRAVADAAKRNERLRAPHISERGIGAALDALERAWKWPLSREDLVREIVSAYLEATGHAKP